MLEHLLDEIAFVVELNDQAWLSRHRVSEVAEAWSRVLTAANSHPLPAPLATFDALLTDTTHRFGTRLASTFLDDLKARMCFAEDAATGEEVVLAMGDTRSAEALGQRLLADASRWKVLRQALCRFGADRFRSASSPAADVRRFP